MKLFELTNQGLAVIGLLVCLLWGVLLVERSLNERTQQQYKDLMREWPATPALSIPPQAPRSVPSGPAVG